MESEIPAIQIPAGSRLLWRENIIAATGVKLKKERQREVECCNLSFEINGLVNFEERGERS